MSNAMSIKRRPFLEMVLACWAALAAACMAQDVVTHSGDNARSGVFQSTITVADLRAFGVRRRTTIPVVGDARGMEAQPLILAGVTVADGSVHDVMVLPSMANVVRGVDAHTGTGLWQVVLGTPVDGGPAIDMHRINEHWGVLSTGVIDRATQRVYLVAWISADGTPTKGVHWMYTLDVRTGAVVAPPVSFAGLGAGNDAYGKTMRKQRCALTETTVKGRSTVFGCWGTVLEVGRYAAGAIFSFDVQENRFSAYLPMSAGVGAGMWMAGQGLNADAAGELYGVTGNGSFDGVRDFGEAMVQVHYTPPGAAGAIGSLKVVGEFSPYSDAGRIGGNPVASDRATALAKVKLAGASQPSEDMKMPVGGGMAVSLRGARAVAATDAQTGGLVVRVYPADAKDAAWNDEDLGSAGCALVEAYHLLVCAGKDGIAYPIDTRRWPNTKPADFSTMKANCAKLAAAPVWATASPGDVDPCPQDLTTLNFMPWGKTRHLHATPVQYTAPDGQRYLFFGGENSTIHKWRVGPAGALTYVAESRETASAEATGSPGGMPGSFCSLGTDHFKPGTSILWCSLPYGDANATLTGGRLIAYDPETLDAGGHLAVLWDSQQWGLPYRFNKFMPPVLFGDEVVLPNYDGGVDVYGR